MVYVYIAAPYSQGDPVLNTRAAIATADWLLERDFVPFVPHLSMFWHAVSPKPYEEWLAYDNEWLQRCDCVLRLPGESHGADKEVALAESFGIPVFTDKESLVYERALGTIVQRQMFLAR